MKPSEIFEGEDSSLKKAFENTKTMRERLAEIDCKLDKLVELLTTPPQSHGGTHTLEIREYE